MLSLSSTDNVLAAVRTAQNVSVLAYTLRPGRIENALIAAARRGAHVHLRLEGQPYHDPAGELVANNTHAIDALRAAGADAQLVHEAGSNAAPLHAKAILADDQLFLDDRNWADDDAETILRDDFAADQTAVADAVNGTGDKPTPFFSIRKRDALASEARLVHSAHEDDDVIVESESFGAQNRVYYALDDLAKEGMKPRLLVAAQDLTNNPHERDALQALERDGVQVRVIDADEKFALVGKRGWVGSTNASPAFDKPDQLDWGMRTDQTEIVTHLHDVFETRWNASVPLDTSLESEQSVRVGVGN